MSKYYPPLVAYGAGFLLMRLGDYDAAHSAMQEARDLYRALADARREAWAMNDLGLVALNQGEVDQAEAIFLESLAMKRRRGDGADIAITVGNLGEVARSRGDRAAALAHYAQALAILRADGEPVENLFEITTLFNLGYLDLAEGKLATAAARFREGLSLVHRLQEPLNLAVGLAGLAAVVGQSGHGRRAATLFGAAEGLLERTGARLDRTDAADWQQHLVVARALLPAEAWDAARAAGAMMGAGEAVAYALHEDTDA